MHGHGNADELRLAYGDLVKSFDRYIETAGLVSGLFQKAKWLRDREWLVPEFVAGNQKDSARPPQG
jgi:hypothetical protein